MVGPSRCEFSKAHCSVRSLHIAHQGVCDATTPGSAQTPGGDAVDDDDDNDREDEDEDGDDDDS